MASKWSGVVRIGGVYDIRHGSRTVARGLTAEDAEVVVRGLNANDDLAEALKAVAVSPGRPLNDGGCSRMLTPETATMVAAALAEAQVEA